MLDPYWNGLSISRHKDGLLLGSMLVVSPASLLASEPRELHGPELRIECNQPLQHLDANALRSIGARKRSQPSTVQTDWGLEMVRKAVSTELQNYWQRLQSIKPTTVAGIAARPTRLKSLRRALALMKATMR